MEKINIAGGNDRDRNAVYARSTPTTPEQAGNRAILSVIIASVMAAIVAVIRRVANLLSVKVVAAFVAWIITTLIIYGYIMKLTTRGKFSVFPSPFILMFVAIYSLIFVVMTVELSSNYNLFLTVAEIKTTEESERGGDDRIDGGGNGD